MQPQCFVFLSIIALLQLRWPIELNKKIIQMFTGLIWLCIRWDTPREWDWVLDNYQMCPVPLTKIRSGKIFFEVILKCIPWVCRKWNTLWVGNWVSKRNRFVWPARNCRKHPFLVLEVNWYWFRSRVVLGGCSHQLTGGDGSSTFSV